ncbi:MAG: transcription elongation factor GreA [Alphaproteobacteria bacterium]|nr:MAG: transcription elongation factor GreA [Alphaproteobacteria bacterium]
MIMKKPITKDGFKKLQDRLQILETVNLPRIIDAISKARALGDLSENAEYKAAKEEQAKINSEIRNIRLKINNSRVLAPKPSDSIMFGAEATLVDLSNSIEFVYKFVGDYESDYESGKISISSLLGKAAVGKKAGEKFIFSAPAGTKEFQVLTIKYSKN